MAKGFAQIATAGKYSLETVYSHFEDGKEWEWWARAINPGAGLPEFYGRASTVDAAKKDAMKSIGVVINPGWRDHGPLLDLPD